MSTKHFGEFGEIGELNFEKRPTWNMYYMRICEIVKTRSPDIIKVGCVLVSMIDNRIISTGYNSVCANMDHSTINWTDRELVSNVIIHAEINALLYSQSKFEDAILYITRSPCIQCLKAISATKIKKIVYKDEHKDFKIVKNISKILGIELIKFENDF